MYLNVYLVDLEHMTTSIQIVTNNFELFIVIIVKTIYSFSCDSIQSTQHRLLEYHDLVSTTMMLHWSFHTTVML